MAEKAENVVLYVAGVFVPALIANVLACSLVGHYVSSRAFVASGYLAFSVCAITGVCAAVAPLFRKRVYLAPLFGIVIAVLVFLFRAQLGHNFPIELNGLYGGPALGRSLPPRIYERYVDAMKWYAAAVPFTALSLVLGVRLLASGSRARFIITRLVGLAVFAIVSFLCMYPLSPKSHPFWESLNLVSFAFAIAESAAAAAAILGLKRTYGTKFIKRQGELQ